MIAIRTMLRKLRCHQGGATAIEYGLIVSLISVAAIGAMTQLGGGSGGSTKVAVGVDNWGKNSFPPGAVV